MTNEYILTPHLYPCLSQQRLEGGMFNQQQAACVIAYAAIFDPASYHIAQRRLATEQVRVTAVLSERVFCV